jgi:ribosomal protein L16 Arg81 hydroxylase
MDVKAFEIFEVSVAVFLRIQVFGKRRWWVNAVDFEKQLSSGVDAA